MNIGIFIFGIVIGIVVGGIITEHDNKISELKRQIKEQETIYKTSIESLTRLIADWRR